MKPTMLMVLVLLVLLTVPQAMAQFVSPGATIPVIANIPGENDTFWRSDVSVVNIADTATSVTLQLFPEIIGGVAAFDAVTSDPIEIAAGGQITLSNAMQTEFGLVNAKGALRLFSNNGAPLVVSSRTYTNDPDGGTYGQDVYGSQVVGNGWLGGLRNDGFYRTNIGIFWGGFDPVQFTVIIFDATGTEVARGVVPFNESGLKQRSLDRFGAGMLVAGYARIECSLSGDAWFGYASTVDEITGDAVYRNAQGYFSFPTK